MDERQQKQGEPKGGGQKERKTRPRIAKVFDEEINRRKLPGFSKDR